MSRNLSSIIRTVPIGRILLGCLLAGMLLGLCVHYGASVDEAWPYPTDDQIVTAYDQHVSEPVLLWATVETIEEDSMVVIVDGPDPDSIRLHVPMVPAVEPGGTVQVYGTLRSDFSIDPSAVVVVDRTPEAIRFKYGISLFGMLITGILFLVHWRPTWRGFAPRRGGTE